MKKILALLLFLAAPLSAQVSWGPHTTLWQPMNGSPACSPVPCVTPGNIVWVSGSDFTDANASGLQAITPLSWTMPANVAINMTYRCELMYSQATGAVLDGFGIQDVTVAPTNIASKGIVWTAAAVAANANLPTLSSTTATAIVTFTPSAITTVFNATITGFIEQPANASSSVIQLMVQQATAANLITIKRGSFCVLGD